MCCLFVNKILLLHVESHIHSSCSTFLADASLSLDDVIERTKQILTQVIACRNFPVRIKVGRVGRICLIVSDDYLVIHRLCDHVTASRVNDLRGGVSS